MDQINDYAQVNKYNNIHKRELRVCVEFTCYK